MSDGSNPTETIEINLELGGEPFAARLTVPAGPARPRVVLPLFQALANVAVDVAEKQTVADGKSISCKKGCGACCRQMVPISRIEAYQLAELIEKLPSPRRELIMARFDAAGEKLKGAGMLDALRESQNLPMADLNAMGLAYFSLQIACPFLEDESCSIHPDRPLACREYLVTSPAELCSRPSPESIVRVELPVHLSRSLHQFGNPPGDSTRRWVPLILAPQWAAGHPEPPPSRTGPELVDEAIGLI